MNKLHEVDIMNTLVNLEKFTEPVNTLILKISDAIGVLYEPLRIVRKARAEAKTEEIMALSSINIEDIQRRALQRFMHEETRKQENIERVIEKAIPSIKEDAKSEDIEIDWLVRFFESVKLISDNEMQFIWSQILADETNSPGTYSKSTIRLLAELEKSDAVLFADLCKFKFNINFERDYIIIYDLAQVIYHKFKITFASLTHLDNIGLIKFSPGSEFCLKELPQKSEIIYYGNQISITFKEEKNGVLEIGYVVFTKIGEQLANICTSIPENGILDYTIEKWKNQGLEVEYLFKIQD